MNATHTPPLYEDCTSRPDITWIGPLQDGLRLAVTSCMIPLVLLVAVIGVGGMGLFALVRLHARRWVARRERLEMERAYHERMARNREVAVQQEVARARAAAERESARLALLTAAPAAASPADDPGSITDVIGKLEDSVVNAPPVSVAVAPRAPLPPFPTTLPTGTQPPHLAAPRLEPVVRPSGAYSRVARGSVAPRPSVPAAPAAPAASATAAPARPAPPPLPRVTAMRPAGLTLPPPLPARR